MSEHELIEVHREAGVKEARFHAVCSCGWISGDHGTRTPGDTEPIGLALADHKLHAEGKDPAEAADHSTNPGVINWSDRIREEGR